MANACVSDDRGKRCPSTHELVLAKYPTAVLALRSALRDSRLGLMFGAGVTQAFEFDGKRPPSWTELVERLEADLTFDGTDRAYARLSATQKVEVLFRVYLRSEGVTSGDKDSLPAATGRWRDKVRTHLYETIPPGGSCLTTIDSRARY